MKTLYPYLPDHAIAPGATLRELIDEKYISQSDLAVRTGLTEKTISQIINGVAPISYETAEKFELVLGVPARFWNSRESQYREALLRIEDAKRLESEVEWLSMIPVKELLARGYVPAVPGKSQQVREALKFFQVSSKEAWETIWLKPQVQFRGGKAQHDHPGFVAAWIRMGEIAAEKTHCHPYDERRFRSALDAIRQLMTESADVWLPKMKELCAAAGVAVVLVKEIPSAGVSGATKWLSKDKAVILLSLKYKSDDQFWFSFFHEACHVLKHSKKVTFYENGHSQDSPEEAEANRFAGDLLIPPEFERRLPHLKSKVLIKAFAAEIGVPPGVVVGRLQKKKLLPPSHCNDLKGKYQWA